MCVTAAVAAAAVRQQGQLLKQLAVQRLEQLVVQQLEQLVELAEVFAEVDTEIDIEILTDVLADIAVDVTTDITAEAAAEIAADITTDIATEVLAEVSGGLGYCLQIQPIMLVVQAQQGLGETSQCLSRTEFVTELKVRAEIRQLKELEVFNSLRLSVVVAAEVLVDIFTDIAAEIAADVAVEVIAEAVAGRLGYYFGGLNTN